MPVPQSMSRAKSGESSLSRRAILRAGLGLPAIYGLSALLGCRGREAEPGMPRPIVPTAASDTAATPDWWQYFVSEAKQSKYGEAVVVLRIPSTLETRGMLGENLVDLVDHGTYEDRLLMMGTTVGCLTDAQRKALVPTAHPDDGLVLIDGDAKRVDGVPLSDADARDRAKVRAALERIAYGEDDARLKERAKAVREEQKGESLDAYDRLKTPEDVEKAATIAYTIVPAIVAELRASGYSARRLALQQVVDRDARDNHSPAHPAFRMPKGIATDSEGGGCSSLLHGGVAVSCGMAMPTPGSYRFLHFLVDTPG